MLKGRFYLHVLISNSRWTLGRKIHRVFPLLKSFQKEIMEGLERWLSG